MEVLNSRQMELADKHTIETIGIPSTVLMENAAHTVFHYFENLNLNSKKIAVVVGSGNNGGDGLAIARLLLNAKYDIMIYLCADPEKFKGDALINYGILKNLDAPFTLITNDDFSFNEYDVIFDAIFGTGLSREIKGRYAEIVKKINDSNAIKIAVDIPSGLNGMTSNLQGICVNAHHTVTFCRPKIPHVLYPSKAYCGNVCVSDISIPDVAVEKQNPNLFLLTENNIPKLKTRKPDSHKGTYGHAVIIGGSIGKSGAAVMASKACLKAGAGLVTAIIPESINLAFETSFLEGMSFPVGKDFLSIKDLDKILKFVENKSVIAIGPGIGTNPETVKFVNEFLKSTDKTAVIDADGINDLDKDTLKKRGNNTIITPHIGEFARLLNMSVSKILENRVELLKNFTTEFKIFVVLKSADTLICTPEGKIFICNFGNPSLAKGGSGDCLTGLITSFISQGYKIEDACKLGVFVLGKTAEKVSEETNIQTVITTQIIDNIWKTLNDI